VIDQVIAASDRLQKQVIAMLTAKKKQLSEIPGPVAVKRQVIALAHAF
jgi:hypothetical protein